MQSKLDPRHQKRLKIVKELFANEFSLQDASPATAAIIKESVELDKLIVEAAPEWPIEKINKIDLAILRLALWEIKNKKAPVKVIIDEAVEIGKTYGSDSTPAFVNGVLGKIIKTKE